MSYRNNPNAAYYAVVDPTAPLDSLSASIKKVVRSIVGPEETYWASFKDEELELVQLTGGISNVLYILSHVSDNRKVIVRVYGTGTSAFIDRGTENIVFAHLSKLGIGPTFHGRFQNGRVEGYLPGTALESHEMRNADVYPHVAEAVAELHQLELAEIRSVRWMWAKIDTFVKLAQGMGV
jgi:thiamine kinase-like enzyme